jgi:hypothetical protein
MKLILKQAIVSICFKCFNVSIENDVDCLIRKILGVMYSCSESTMSSISLGFVRKHENTCKGSFSAPLRVTSGGREFHNYHANLQQLVIDINVEM